MAIVPDATAPAERAVHCLRDANGESLNTAREPRRLVRFHEQMQMIGLNAERQKAEVRGARGAEGGPEHRKQPFVSEGGDIGARPQGHVDWTARHVWRARGVRHAAATRLGFAPGPVALSAPGSRPELELSHHPSHLDFGRKLSYYR